MNVSEITLGRIFISSYLRELAVDIQGVSGAEDVISKHSNLQKENMRSVIRRVSLVFFQR